MTKKIRLLFILFIFVLFFSVFFGIIFIIRNINEDSGIFKKDGYAISVMEKSAKTDILPFNSGTTYNYKKYDNKVSFKSENKVIKVDESNVIHYQDKSLLLLKKVVGLDLEDIDKNVIFYYNIFKNTEISFKDNKFSIDTKDNDKIIFDNLLLRISDTKYLIASKNVRTINGNDEITDFGDYLYFEYGEGSIVKLYNKDKYYQTISDSTKIVSGDITIDLTEGTISKENNPLISLTNLVIDMNSNIDVLVKEEKVEDLNINTPNDLQDNSFSKNSDSSDSIDNNGGSNSINGDVDHIIDENSNNEEIVNDTINHKAPVYKLTKLNLTALKLDATIEIQDEDSLLISGTDISIVENATAKTVYETTIEEGDLFGNITYLDLKPDTEYTLYAKATYKVDEIEYNKSFISKIFRTEALGVSFEKSYVTDNSISIDLLKEKYSNVSSATIGIFEENGTEIENQTINFNNEKSTFTFDNLDNNKNYLIKMYDILLDGVIVDNGFSQKENIKTLKKAPQIGELNYTISKSSSSFELNVSSVIDSDLGIKNYRYEIFDARQDMNNDTPLLTLSKENLNSVNIKVDDNQLYHGIAYTYRLVVEFDDNEKIVEYAANLGKTMQIDGVAFPTVRWEETKVTWEQINGTIVIDDPSGAIMSDDYKIVYKNSVDAYNIMSITTETNKNAIPISVNYLRANETYTFDVYASINLQDGNPTVNQTYIGSIKVQTKSPNSFSALFSNNSSYSDAFSINFSLTSANKDASFEAKTLSSLIFTLYQGSSTEGKVEVYRKVVDTNDLEYTSVLGEKYFDNPSIIDPEFFNSENSDFKQKTYTLVVDGSYDYTGYDSNIIPIENNTYQFELSNYIPVIPETGEDQIAVNSILNRNAENFGLEYDTTLDPNTVIGYNVTAKYDNTSGVAKNIIYHVYRYNPITQKYEKIPLDKTISFSDDGVVPSAVFPIGKGTPTEVLDSDMLRRGNSYYFSYEANLDANKDGMIDTVYPSSINPDLVLKSNTLKAYKQTSKIITYPSTSSKDSFSWKYLITDVDNCLDNNYLYGFVNANNDPSSTIPITINNNFQIAKFTNLSSGNNFTMKKKERYLKGEDSRYESIASQYFYGETSSLDLSYSVHTEDNRLILTIDDYNSKTELVDKIASLDVVITPKNSADLSRLGKKTLKNVPLTNGEVSIDYYSISAYSDVDLEVQLIAYFDTGKIGFDLTSDYKAVQAGSYGEAGTYYSFGGSRPTQASSIFGNMIKARFDYDNKAIYVEDISGHNSVLNINEINESGVVYLTNNILLKEIKSQPLSSSNNEASFSFIIPGISVLDSSNKLKITTLLDKVSIDASIIVPDSSNIQDNLTYIELYETDQQGKNAKFIRTIEKTVSNYNEPITISNLKSQTNYYIRFYAFVYNKQTNSYVKTYLYDIEQKAIGCIYNFHTLSDVGITNVATSFTAYSYSDKKLVITYDLENVNGFDHIEYTLYKLTDNGYVPTNISIPNSSVFFKNMRIEIDATPGVNPEIVYGGQYKIVIKPIGYYESEEGTTTIDLGTVGAEFTIEECEEPYIGISAGKTENSIYFRVSINDPSYVISDGHYSYQLVDSKGNVISTKNNLDISRINRKFSFNNTDYDLQNDEKYQFIVIANADYQNNSTDFIEITKERTITFGTSVDLGTVIVSDKNASSKSVNIIFSDSYRLTDITTVSYVVGSITTGFYYSNTSDFVTVYDSNQDIYYYTLTINEDFTPNTIYQLSFNFYEENLLVQNIELDYYAGGS